MSEPPARVLERAEAMRRAHRLDGVVSDAALRHLLAAEGLVVFEGCPFGGRVREVYASGVLGIRAGVSPGWVRWLKCHGLGHHTLHRGNHLYVRDGLYLWQRQEIEAELFAGALLLGEQSPIQDLAALAEAAAVPVECVQAWQAALLSALEDRPRDGAGPGGDRDRGRPTGIQPGGA